MLELKHLTFSVEGEGNQKDILKDVSLDVKDGTFLVVTGPNGGGKTTLAKTIMGLNQPTSGQIIWNGEDITDLNITERARRGISYGFQQPPRFKGLRVWDLLSLASGNPQLTHAEGCQLLTQVGLCAADYIDREVDNSLSGGEVKRIEIATILARKSPLMIFDEPEAGIDLWSFKSLIHVFRQMHEDRKETLVIISHQERILRIADEIVLLADGTVQAQGPGDEMMMRVLTAGGVKAACCREEALFRE